MHSAKQLFRKVAFGERLAQARTRLQFSQETLAQAVGTTSRSINRWEHDQTIPRQYYRERLCDVLQLTTEELFGTSDEEQQATSPSTPLWYVPYARNLYFTGRETVLNYLHEKLHDEQQISLTQPHVVCGIGGIGKTQTALEYAYRFRSDYHAVLWIGAETTETLMADCRALAHFFQLPEQDSSDQTFLREAVKRWFLNQRGWLLIFDNVENLELLNTWLPDASQGYILITTRSQIVATLGFPIDLQKMELAEGALFLLRRARLLRYDEPLEKATTSLRTQADTLVDLLDGLPLALDQAGAYIEESACTLSNYLQHYTMRRDILLNSRGTVSNHHPASVTLTLTLSFQRVEQAFSPAADLLRLCAFLHADAIPEKFITQAGETLGPVLQSLSADPMLLDAAIKELRRFSLLQREAQTGTFSIHRLLQVIIKDNMNEDDRKQWIERIIQVMLQIFPDYRKADHYGVGEQSYCQQYLPHALACAATLIEWNIISLAAGEFLYRLGCYLQFWETYTQAESLLLQAIHIVEKLLGIENLIVPTYLDELAYVYIDMKQYVQAEKYYRQALTIREKLKGPDHLEVAESLGGLAILFCNKGLFIQAEFLAQRALTINEQTLGSNHYKVGLLFNILGISSMLQGKYIQAEQLLQKAAGIYEKTLRVDHFYLAYCLKPLGHICSIQEKYTKAVILYRCTLQIYQINLGKNHPAIAYSIHRLGNVYFVQKQYKKAEDCYRKSLAIFSKLSKPHYFYAAYTFIDLGELYLVQDRLLPAQRALQRALTILGKTTPVDRIDHEEITRYLLLVAEHLEDQHELIEARFYYQRALVIGETILGLDHPLTISCRSGLKKTLVSTNSAETIMDDNGD